jgi:hypothetical protein
MKLGTVIYFKFFSLSLFSESFSSILSETSPPPPPPPPPPENIIRSPVGESVLSAFVREMYPLLHPSRKRSGDCRGMRIRGVGCRWWNHWRRIRGRLFRR